MEVEEKMNLILRNNLEMAEVVKKHITEYKKALDIMQCFFNDYTSVASELSGIPESVIVARIKDCSNQPKAETNHLFVVKDN